MPNSSPSGEKVPEAPGRRAARHDAGSVEAQPFLKWAGGKAQLLKQFDAFFPKSIRTYCEPFLGGGAVFFHLKARFPKMRAALRDNNPELINCYQAVRDSAEELMSCLDAHLEQFRAKGQAYYYEVRKDHKKAKGVERAGRMIFLNKTCYNGLWRVNGRGEFNVPIGSYRPERVSLYDRENLLAASAALKDTDLRVQDFRKTMKEAREAGFVYIDPPYYPLSRTANFTSYTQEMFGQAEQEELARLFAAAAKEGAQLMLSNSDTEMTRGLYAAFTLKTVQARRAVNSDGAKRGRIPELVVLS
jgi:DNA adenine methylase